jgi:signal transduction histidine kinase
MQKSSYDITIFLAISSLILVTLIAFIICIIYLYGKRQHYYLHSLQQMKLSQEQIVLAAQLEIQEDTFRNISREIHDNISTSLSLAKLYLNTIELKENCSTSGEKLNGAISLVTCAITELRDISRGLNGDIIIEQGLLNALRDEVDKISKTQIFKIDFTILGNTVYMDSKKELVIFRVIQEGFNNIINHAGAKSVELKLDYGTKTLNVQLMDNGHGFDLIGTRNRGAGLINMKNRVKSLNGEFDLFSKQSEGTWLIFTIPY